METWFPFSIRRWSHKPRPARSSLGPWMENISQAVLKAPVSAIFRKTPVKIQNILKNDPFQWSVNMSDTSQVIQTIHHQVGHWVTTGLWFNHNCPFYILSACLHPVLGALLFSRIFGIPIWVLHFHMCRAFTVPRSYTVKAIFRYWIFKVFPEQRWGHM